MPRARNQPPELDPHVVYVAWQSSAALVDGVEALFREGDRLPGDHPTVRATWWCWLPDGHSPAQTRSATRCLYSQPD